MRVSCRLEFPYPTKREAELVARSLKVDDEKAYIATRVEGKVLVAEATADSFRGLLHTLEDYLACLAVAEKVLGR
ncbi:MAG: hypothetical protein A3K65_06655 [Euryarchaeota archaeon RBG_16_68_12]|nr:MAG: hypothetical protein A3K65_06655 [Euryarchaeota archaeon RBG_16_68_12]